MKKLLICMLFISSSVMADTWVMANQGGGQIVLTGQDLCDLEIAVGWKGDSYDFEVIAKAVIAKFKEKNK